MLVKRASVKRDVLRSTFVVMLGLASCEPRAPEPVSRETVAPPPATESAPAPPKACVEAWPSAPTREVKGPVPNPSCPDDPGPVPTLRLGVVRFPELGTLEVAVEIAEKNDDRMRGLMYRKELNDGAGMLFVFEEERNLQFWMKNTCIPLDMIFISADGTIVSIEENTPTLSTASFGPRKCGAKFVLEVNAGWARRNGLKPGTKVALPHAS